MRLGCLPKWICILDSKLKSPRRHSKRLNVIVHSDAQVLRTNPPLGKNGSSFRKHQSSPAHGPAAQMHKMPVARVSVRAGVLAHKRNKYAVCKRNIPNRERIKQMSHRVYTAFLNSEEAPNLWPVVIQRVARVFPGIYSMHAVA